MEQNQNSPFKFDPDLGRKLPLRILVAEDNLVNQKVILNLLKRLGFAADIANNGREAVDAFKDKDYDLILMDVMMPEMSGEEATQMIRQTLPKERQPRIVALTANAMTGDRERLLQGGMDDYLAKPIEIEALVRALSQSQKTAVNNQSLPAASQPAGAAVDTAVLDEFLAMMGEEGQGVLSDLIDLYNANSPMLIEQMRRQISAERYPDLQRAAHTLKGNSYQLGAKPLGDICFEMEKLAKANSLAGAPELLQKISIEFSRVKQELEARLLQHP